VKSGETVYRCRAKGAFKEQGIKPAVGDEVRFQVGAEEDNTLITEILPRKNVFIRPFVANVDCFAVVTSIARPAPVPAVVDKLLVMAEHAGTDVILCINKCDLAMDQRKASGRRAAENLEMLRSIYEPVYPVVLLSQEDPEGYERFARQIQGKQTALAGASGVGKSTILNRLLQYEHMETGDISEKTQRGRHTTRHAELFLLDGAGTAIFDTPGFTSFSLTDVEPAALQHYFPEIAHHLGHCRYDNCRHAAEPDCGVKRAVAEGKIGKARYESYLSMMKELEEANRY
jgi:ribosome biogenesis GTPase